MTSQFFYNWLTIYVNTNSTYQVLPYRINQQEAEPLKGYVCATQKQKMEFRP